MLEDGRIAVFSVQNDSQGECEVALLTKTQKENVPEKTVITYGCVYPSSLLCAQVVRFNKLNTQFRIELKQYTEGSMDILSGNAPDILDIGAGFSEEENFALIEAGALEDLTSLYSEHYGDKKLVQGFSRGKMLEVLCRLNMDRFVDQETGECHFEEESFLQILELAGRFGGEEKQAGFEQVRNGEILFMEASLLSVSDFQYYEYLFGDEVRREFRLKKV